MELPGLDRDRVKYGGLLQQVRLSVDLRRKKKNFVLDRRLTYMSRYAIRDQIRRLDAEKDHQRIVFLSTCHDFPFDTTRALEFALFPKSPSSGDGPGLPFGERKRVVFRVAASFANEPRYC